MSIELYQRLLLSYLNIPYIFGGKNPLTGEDCSGLVCEVLKALGAIGTNEEFGSQQLYNKFKDQSKLGVSKPGSLVFYGKSLNSIDHVAIFLDDKHVLEAGHGTADTLSKEIAAQRGAYSRVRPFHYRQDYLEILNIDLGLI